MTSAQPPKSTGAMMTDILGNVGNLVRNEVDLARAEIVGSLTKAGGTLATMMVALVLAVSGVTVLSASAVIFMTAAGVPLPWATLIVGIGLLVIAYAMFRSATSALKQIGFVPTRAARNLQRDAAAIKEPFHDQ